MEYYENLLWYVAVSTGWLAIIAHSLAWYAGQKFRALLKAPLSEEVEHKTRLWEQQIGLWTAIGIIMSGLSILSFASWLTV
jgi:hypothetical protein